MRTLRYFAILLGLGIMGAGGATLIMPSPASAFGDCGSSNAPCCVTERRFEYWEQSCLYHPYWACNCEGTIQGCYSVQGGSCL